MREATGLPANHKDLPWIMEIWLGGQQHTYCVEKEIEKEE
jgi:hypothetical protein